MIRLGPTVRQRSPAGAWEMIPGVPEGPLRGVVVDCCGYSERTPGPQRRRELPRPQVVLIVDLGPTLRIVDRQGAATWYPGGFVAGVDDGHTVTESPGRSDGIQINFTLEGARRFFGVPMHELATRVVQLDDLLRPAERRLLDRVRETTDWARRFECLASLVAARIERAAGPPAWLAAAWAAIQRSGGLVPVGDLVHETGFSRKHIADSFGRWLGMPPKRLARLVRFDRMLNRLGSGRHPNWTAVALEAGYYDQAHFVREFRAFSGSTPTEFIRARETDRSGLPPEGMPVTSVQAMPAGTS